MSVVLTGGRVVTSLDPVVLVDADVVVEDGRVSAVGPAPEGAARRDCSGCVIVPGSVPATPDVGGRADSCAVMPRVTTAGAPSCLSTTIIAASMPSISIAASSTRSMSSSRSIELPISPKIRFRRLSCSARSSASDRPPASSSIFVRISSTARTRSSFGGVLAAGVRRLTITPTTIAATTRAATTIRTAVARFPGTSSENYSPCNHTNGGCNLERGTPHRNVLPGVDAHRAEFRSAGRQRAPIGDRDDDGPGAGLIRLPEGVLGAAEAGVRVVLLAQLGDACAEDQPGVVVRRLE